MVAEDNCALVNFSSIVFELNLQNCDVFSFRYMFTFNFEHLEAECLASELQFTCHVSEVAYIGDILRTTN